MVHPYPTPKLGISARHAVSNLSGCGGGAPHPIVTPHPWFAARARGVVQISGSVLSLLYAAGTGFGRRLSICGRLPFLLWGPATSMWRLGVSFDAV